MEVTSQDVASYLPRIERFARSLNGVGGAEYDDLRQEGMLKVFLLLRDEQPVTNVAIKNAMRDWVRYCRRKGFAEPMEDNTLDYHYSAAPGRKRTVLAGDSTGRGSWVRWADPIG